ncbi:MAG: glycosyltransferase family 4 protein [Myxococcota bacterium]
MHVAHVCRSGWPAIGGIESAVQGLAAALVRRGHDATVVTLDRAPDGARLHPAVHQGVVYRRLARVGPRRFPFAQGLTPHLRDADIVHVHGIDGLVHQVARVEPAARVGLSTHGGFFHTPRHRWLKWAVWRAVTCPTLRGLDAVWFSSAADAERFGSDVAGRVVPNGIDGARYAGPDRRPCVDRWAVLGRVVPHKGLADLLEVLRRQRDPVPELDVIGPIDEAGRAWLQQGSEGLSTRIRVWGSRSVRFVAARLARAAWVVFPSRYEGFGLAALEVMAAGVPAIVADIPALGDAVARGGGQRVDFRDPTRAASALDAIRALGVAEAIGEQARVAALRADWGVRVEGFLQAYEAA